MSTQLPALREWAATCTAIARGDQTLLIRKGGIAEGGDGFTVDARRFALLPTLFHQAKGQPAPADDVVVTVVCELVFCVEVAGDADVEPLAEFHRYDPEQLAVRLRYKPERPLTLMAVRAFSLAEPLVFSADAIRPVCKSWLSLPVDAATLRLMPVDTGRAMSKLVAGLKTFNGAMEVASVG